MVSYIVIAEVADNTCAKCVLLVSATIYSGSNTSQNTDNLAVNHSTAEAILASGRRLAVYLFPSCCLCEDECTVHDTENLTFSADYRADNLQVAAQPSTYVHADN